MKRPTPSWLSAAIFYELYPQSFLDTNGDGIGDLPGVIAKLDYIKSLGCNAVWLNPCFVSPMGDAGYDVADFYHVDPRYGTDADLVALFAAAHARGMKVCLDLVAGHTSTAHPWFQASAQAKRNKYSDWYIWTNSAWERPAPPRSAPAVPGAPATIVQTMASAPLQLVRGFGERDGGYVANYFYFQPALNYGFAHPDPARPWQLPVSAPGPQAVRREMKKIIRHFLDLGCDGFRVDMAFSLVKGDTDFRETMLLWRDMRAMFDRHYPECALISEWSDPEKAITAGFHMDFLIHLGHPGYTSLFRAEPERNRSPDSNKKAASYFDRRARGDVRPFVDHYLAQLAATRGLGYISVPTGNHDIIRLAHGRTPDEQKVAMAFFYTLPGIPYLYNGDEIGMDYARGLVSVEGAYTRTGSRTPMQWDSSANAGFSTAPKEKLYLPVTSKQKPATVAGQDRDPASLLNFLRALGALRQKTPALQADGDFTPVYAQPKKYPFAYLRTLHGDTILVVLNPSGKSVAVTLDLPVFAAAQPLLPTAATLTRTRSGVRLKMPAVSSGLFRLITAP
jgi:maltose alpha-D-glucosyltransferase/alpha-amylase